MRTQQDRQEEEWSVPTNIERRENDVKRCELSRAPPTPPLSGDRLFTDWSSLDSPRVRTSPQNVSVQDTEQVINQPDNQTYQPGTEPVQVEVIGNTLNDDVTTLSNLLTAKPSGYYINRHGDKYIRCRSKISKRWSKNN